MSKCRAKNPANCPYHGAAYRAETMQKTSHVLVEETSTVITDTEVQTVTHVEVVPELSWDDDVAAQVLDDLPEIRPTTPSVMSQKLNQLAKQHSFKIDYERFSSQALASQMGTILEHVYKRQMNKTFSDDKKVTYFRGDDVKSVIMKMRNEATSPELAEVFKKHLMKEYYFSEEYATEILKHSNWMGEKVKAKSIHIPDAIVIDRSGDKVVVKCGEMKASGQNDSSSIPENIDKMVEGTRNSAIEPWVKNPNVTVDRAILITASTVNQDGGFPYKTKWETEIGKLKRPVDREAIKVFCNHEAFNWLSNKTISASRYEEDFITTTAFIELKRLAQTQNQPLL